MGGIEATDDERMAEANRLYWESERSVNQIAEDLGLSKSSLYEAIDPLPSGLGCPECGAELVVPNRTALERSLLTCLECGADATRDEAVTLDAETDGEEPDDGSTAPRRGEPSGGHSVRTLVGTAVLSLGVGLLIGRTLRDR